MTETGSRRRREGRSTRTGVDTATWTMTRSSRSEDMGRSSLMRERSLMDDARTQTQSGGSRADTMMRRTSTLDGITRDGSRTEGGKRDERGLEGGGRPTLWPTRAGPGQRDDG